MLAEIPPEIPNSPVPDPPLELACLPLHDLVKLFVKLCKLVCEPDLLLLGCGLAPTPPPTPRGLGVLLYMDLSEGRFLKFPASVEMELFLVMTDDDGDSTVGGAGSAALGGGYI